MNLPASNMHCIYQRSYCECVPPHSLMCKTPACSLLPALHVQYVTAQLHVSLQALPFTCSPGLQQVTGLGHCTTLGLGSDLSHTHRKTPLTHRFAKGVFQAPLRGAVDRTAAGCWVSECPAGRPVRARRRICRRFCSCGVIVGENAPQKPP